MLWLQSGTYTWRFVGSSKWSYKPFNMGYNYGYPTYKPTYNYPWTSKNRHFRTKAHTIWAHGPLGFLMSFLERHIWHQGAVRYWPCQYPGIQARLLHDAFRSETLGQHSRRTMFAEPLIPCIHTRLPLALSVSDSQQTAWHIKHVTTSGSITMATTESRNHQASVSRMRSG